MNSRVAKELAVEVSLLSSRQLAGQLLVVGFDGSESAPPALLSSLQAAERAGVVLFRRNIDEGLEGLHRVAQLNQSLIDASPDSYPPLIAIDEEGGRVARLSAPALRIPPLRTVATNGGAPLLEQVAQAVGAQLGALGFSMNFAPVVDVDTNPENPIIGDRALSHDAECVVELAETYNRGLTAGGVQHCLKHFPGHGDTLVDSHLGLPRVEHDQERLNEVELLPFQRLACSSDSVMTAHVTYPALDDTQPATLSRRIVHGILREKFGFEGLIFSDDLEMKALAEQGTAGEVAVRAIEAGCDILLVCSEPHTQVEVFDALVEKLKRSEVFRGIAEQAAVRSLALRRRGAPRAASREELDTVLREQVAPVQVALDALVL